jgi:cytidyltransferase-like protein
MRTTVLATGGFDPLHSGHIQYLEQARDLGDRLVVGINSDAWLTRKKGRCFMPADERRAILQSLRCVDSVIEFDDTDGSARQAIQQVLQTYPQDMILFVNGGDRAADNIPEMTVQDHRLQFRFGVGGDIKKNSSSWILQEWKAPKTPRPWGYYRVIHEVPGAKVKELTVEPGQALSMQRHSQRQELWLVTSGRATVYNLDRSTDIELQGHYGKHQYLHISTNDWHQLVNESHDPLKIVEIQYGSQCQEEDIERHPT